MVTNQQYSFFMFCCVGFALKWHRDSSVKVSGFKRKGIGIQA